MRILPRIAAAFAAFLLLATPACARRAAAPAQEAQAQEAQGFHPALFVVRDADSTLYLFGTVHVRRPGAPWGGEDAQAALASADEVWTEIEISPAADARAQQLVAQRGIAPENEPLSSILSAEENARFDALAQRLGTRASTFARMRPWLAAITLTMMPMMQAGYDPAAGVDRAIASAAAGKRMRAFETIEQQIGFLAGLSPEMQHQMLVETIMETEKGPEQLGDLSMAWERGDLDMLEQLVVTDMRDDYPELYQTLFVQRNNAWVETLAHEMDGAGVDFVAVGTGHLVGEDGLVAQLRARGFTVERSR